MEITSEIILKERMRNCRPSGWPWFIDLILWLLASSIGPVPQNCWYLVEGHERFSVSTCSGRTCILPKRSTCNSGVFFHTWFCLHLHLVAKLCICKTILVHHPRLLLNYSEGKRIMHALFASCITNAEHSTCMFKWFNKKFWLVD